MADKTDTAAAELDWLDALERRVRETTARLRELADDNARLAARVAELEAEGDSAASESSDDGAWKEERKAIRTRVEALTRNLENLLDEDP